MAHHLIVVEGAHDAAFLGKLLRREKFSQIQNLADVPEFWSALIPSKYPVDPSGRLDRIIVFPDIYMSECLEHTLALSVAGSDKNLVKTMRAALEIKEVEDFCTITIFTDTDFEVDEGARFNALHQNLSALNAEAEAESQPGFPLVLPSKVGALAEGSPRVGIYLWPGAGQQGTLENVLLDCAEITEPALKAASVKFIDSVHEEYPSECESIRKSRTSSGSLKAKCGGLASVLKPGGSVAVSLRQSRWLPENCHLPESANRARDYLVSILASS